MWRAQRESGLSLKEERMMNGLGKAAVTSMAAVALMMSGGCSEKMKTRPNIIVVLSDDQGFGQLPVYSDDYPDEMLFLTKNTERYKCDEQKAKAAAKACRQAASSGCSSLLRPKLDPWLSGLTISGQRKSVGIGAVAACSPNPSDRADPSDGLGLRPGGGASLASGFFGA